jgi:hypothetical protein
MIEQSLGCRSSFLRISPVLRHHRFQRFDAVGAKDESFAEGASKRTSQPILGSNEQNPKARSIQRSPLSFRRRESNKTPKDICLL